MFDDYHMFQVKEKNTIDRCVATGTELENRITSTVLDLRSSW